MGSNLVFNTMIRKCELLNILLFPFFVSPLSFDLIPHCLAPSYILIVSLFQLFIKATWCLHWVKHLVLKHFSINSKYYTPLYTQIPKFSLTHWVILGPPLEFKIKFCGFKQCLASQPASPFYVYFLLLWHVLTSLEKWLSWGIPTAFALPLNLLPFSATMLALLKSSQQYTLPGFHQNNYLFASIPNVTSIVLL